MSTPAFEQNEPTPWPSGYGDAIAVVRTQPELFSRTFGLTFSGGSDNLDAYGAAAIHLRLGRVVALLRHLGDWGSGTEVHADTADEFVSALREFLDSFDLSVEDLSWMRDDAAEHLRLAEKGAHA